MKQIHLYILLCLVGLSGACAYDNYDEPASVLTGQLLYEGKPVGVKNAEITLDVYEPGWPFREAIPVNVNQDGTFSAQLFESQYKIVRRKDVGAFVNDLDTTEVIVHSHTVQDIEVLPFFFIEEPQYTVNTGILNASFHVEQPVTGKELESIEVYVSTTRFCDAENNQLRFVLLAEEVENLEAVTIEGELGELSNREYVFVRIGVKSLSQTARNYSLVRKIHLP
ncbi:DUF3823 domain-containing protein [Rapidithrix thailandica]|uniref:DUF3823 domain-containing protein n=1 Tax=Rapidithrix thailandica TaxID=413964 RepID=A0AAW9S8D9_9BACT